jgi:hypothetical protein
VIVCKASQSMQYYVVVCKASQLMQYYIIARQASPIDAALCCCA